MPPTRKKPTREQRVEWVWKPIEDLDWSRKKRADMTPAEREFVEVARMACLYLKPKSPKTKKRSPRRR